MVSPEANRTWWNPSRASVVPSDAVVHGQYRLPAGYRLVFVPAWAASEIKTPAGAECNSLASSYNLPKLLVSLLQIVWATTTLYRASGDQIQRFGCAAFGLAVAPYVFMSIMNVAGSFLNPEYAAIFMVRTPLMDEAESKGGFFVGEVRHDAGARPGAEPEFLDIVKQESFLYILSTFCGFIPLAIIGGRSRFEAQDSTTLQSVFTSFWVVLGIFGGTVTVFYVIIGDLGWSCAVTLGCIRKCVYAVGAVASIGGMVVVGQMIRDFGVCTLLSS